MSVTFRQLRELCDLYVGSPCNSRLILIPRYINGLDDGPRTTEDIEAVRSRLEVIAAAATIEGFPVIADDLKAFRSSLPDSDGG